MIINFYVYFYFEAEVIFHNIYLLDGTLVIKPELDFDLDLN